MSEDVVNPALTMRYGEVDREYAHRMATMPPEQDGPVWMVNPMRYREQAEYADGRTTDLSGWQADDMYAPFDSLAAVGAEIAFLGEVEQQVLGDGRHWDQVRFNSFPSREAFMTVVMDPDRLAAQREFREPAMSDTCTMIVRPIIDGLAGSWADEELVEP